jgi:hypothetical protein
LIDVERELLRVRPLATARAASAMLVAIAEGRRPKLPLARAAAALMSASAR